MPINRTLGGREEYSEAVESGRWSAGKGPEALKEAQRMWDEEMSHRSKTSDIAREPMAIEGEIDGEVVYREKSPDGNCPPDLNNIPKGMENEVSYARVSYQIA